MVSVASTTVATAFEVAIGTIHFHCATVATDYSFKMGLVVSSRSCHEWERGVMRESRENEATGDSGSFFFISHGWKIFEGLVASLPKEPCLLVAYVSHAR